MKMSCGYPQKAARLDTTKFKGNEEGCEKYVFTTGDEKKQAAQFTRTIEGLCKHIKKKLERGMLIARETRDREDIRVMLPEDPDPTNPIAL